MPYQYEDNELRSGPGVGGVYAGDARGSDKEFKRFKQGLRDLEMAPEQRVAYNQTELRMIGLLVRVRTILGNMAQEREGFWNSLLGRRRVISHEPLRNDARNLLPLLDAEIEGPG